MFKNIESDIHNEKINYAMISLISDKVNIGLVGFGKAGIIKAKHFISLGCNIEILTKDSILNEFSTNSKIKLLNKEYDSSFIKNKHIVIIAIDDDTVRRKIIDDCNELAKIYVDCTEFRNGIAVIPTQNSTSNLIVGVNTVNGNPRGSVFISNKIKEDIQLYDEFIKYTTFIRNKVKTNPKIKRQVLDFIFSDDFYFFFKKNKYKEIINLFYKEV